MTTRKRRDARRQPWRKPKEPIKLEIKGRDGRLRPAFEVDDATGCWISTGPSTGNNYCRTSGKPAHRDAYERLYGRVPDGFQCHHLCETPKCVNPEHIVAVSVADHAKTHRYLRSARKAEGTPPTL